MLMKKNHFILLYLFFSYSVNMFSQIVNEGTLHINQSTLVYFGEEYTNKSTATHNNHGDK